jgi:ubiquinol-cytochrome c reductase cytochrome c subunit
MPATTPTTQALNSSPNILAEGQQLFDNNCSACHGALAEGSDKAPNLVGLGPATIDFWVSTGRMPLAVPSEQAIQKPPRFSEPQTRAIAAYLASLDPGAGPGIPEVNLNGANLGEGESLFSLNCAGCHTITGVGDALADNVFAPSLVNATPTQIAEAVRTGPGEMPRFGPGTISPQHLDDLVAYVHSAIQHPDNRGGIGLGRVGPVAEGFVVLLVGLGGLMLVSYWIGDRA